MNADRKAEMGQKLSSQPNAPLVWILRGQPKLHPNPEQPIKFQYKTRRKSCTSNTNAKSDAKLHTVQTEYDNSTCIRRSISEDDSKRHVTRHRKRPSENFNVIADAVGYDIEDIDQFLGRASLERPANIPVVLSVPAVLYQTRVGGYQAEIALPLGMVVNAVFRNQHWLYAQTPHGEEGYVAYTACIPLGIIPSADDARSPCWETSTDVFPRPSGNMTDTEKLSTCSEGRRRKGRSKRRACGESNVDRLYLRAASAGGVVRRHTLLVVDEDYSQVGNNTVTVRRGDVVTLLSSHLKGWFWVRSNSGEEGYIPAAVAGYGYL